MLPSNLFYNGIIWFMLVSVNSPGLVQGELVQLPLGTSALCHGSLPGCGAERLTLADSGAVVS